MIGHLVFQISAILLLSAQGDGAAVTTPFQLGPPPGDGPLIVRAGFFLQDINRVDEETGTFEFEGILTLKWHDERLAFDPVEAGVEEKIYQGAYQFNEVFIGWWAQAVLVNESGTYEHQGILLRVRHDGSLIYSEEVDCVGVYPMQLKRFPFDQQDFVAVFQLLGYDTNEVVLELDRETTGTLDRDVSALQWELQSLTASTRVDVAAYLGGHQGSSSSLAINILLVRKPGFMLRVVVIPLIMLVVLSWSVFWMARESLGERMDISFVGILTVVAYQILVSEHQPKIAYFTLMGAFLYLCFLTLFASVVINLLVGRLRGTGRTDEAYQIDKRCRWAFPLAYFGSLGLAAIYFFVRY